jgi:hypothetical protein
LVYRDNFCCSIYTIFWGEKWVTISVFSPSILFSMVMVTLVLSHYPLPLRFVLFSYSWLLWFEDVNHYQGLSNDRFFCVVNCVELLTYNIILELQMWGLEDCMLWKLSI